MRRLTAILVLMTVLLASISCSGAGKGTIPGNGDLQPITEAQPASTGEEQASAGGEPATAGGEPATTGWKPAPETRREKTPGDEGNPEANPEANRETGARTLPGEVIDKPGTETKGNMEDPGTAVETRSEADVAAAGSSPRSPGWREEQVQTELKAGEVDDNRRWQEYLDFVEEYRGPPVHGTNLSNRQIITVLDRQGNPVPNAQVNISRRSDGTGATLTKRTYADGRTIFFPLEGLDPGMAMRNDGQTTGEFSITVRRDGFTRIISIVPETAMEHEVALEGTMTYGLDFPLDVVFLIDSTGSMADEIHRIKATLESIARQVSNLPANPSLRFGMVSYRDREDEYVTWLYPHSTGT